MTLISVWILSQSIYQSITSKRTRKSPPQAPLFKTGEFPFLVGGVGGPFCKMMDILLYTCPNHMKVGAIDHPDRFEDVFNPRYIQEVSERKFTDPIS